MLGRGAVTAQLRAADTETQDAVRPVDERFGDGRRRGPREVRLDEDDVRRVGGVRGGAQCRPVEGPHRRRVEDGDVEALGRGEHLVEQRPHREDDTRAPFAQQERAAPVDGPPPLVRLLREPYVDAVLAAHGMAQQRLGLVGVSGDVHGPPVERVEEGHVARRHVREASGGDVVRGPGADQDAADALVPEVELDLLEGALDEEAREGVQDGPHPGEREPAPGAHQELFADAEVDDPVGVALRRLGEAVAADHGEDDGEALVLAEQGGHGGAETVAHRFHGGAPRSVLGFDVGDDGEGAPACGAV
ncbi:hypothetical protein GA0115246_111063, partial [Streptomyces sp. SolWspMP-sol7th]